MGRNSLIKKKFFLDHFIKNGLKLPKLKSNPNPIKPKVLDTISSSSAENCAYACLTDNKFTTSNERCLGFDFCPNPSGDGFLCKFYNYSIITDNVVVEETLPNCDHYGSMSLNNFSLSLENSKTSQIRNERNF